MIMLIYFLEETGDYIPHFFLLSEFLTLFSFVLIAKLFNCQFIEFVLIIKLSNHHIIKFVFSIQRCNIFVFGSNVIL